MESIPGLEYRLPAAPFVVVGQHQRLQVLRPNVGQGHGDPGNVGPPEFQREVFEIDVFLDG